MRDRDFVLPDPASGPPRRRFLHSIGALCFGALLGAIAIAALRGLSVL